MRFLYRHMLRANRFTCVLCVIGFVWGLAFINMSLVAAPAERTTEQLQAEIIALSEKYVKQLASETRDVIDGPYAGRLTGYDLKKTMAVLLENILMRVEILEKEVVALNASHYLRNHSVIGNEPKIVRYNIESLPTKPARAVEETKVKVEEVTKKLTAEELIKGAQENCTLTEKERQEYPHCNGKMEWMKAHWQSDKCYSLYGVDGTKCSFRVYLSEVENWCPLLPGRSPLFLNNTDTKLTRRAAINYDLEGLMAKLKDPVNRQQNYAWIRQRITRNWPGWVESMKKLSLKQNFDNRKQRKVLVHLGLLSKKSGFKIAENSFKGGPLGELVQWSDIISSLYLLGHDIVITSEVEQLAGDGSLGFELFHMEDNGLATKLKILNVGASNFQASPTYIEIIFQAELRKSCPSLNSFSPDMIMSDITGLKMMKKTAWYKTVEAKKRILSKLPTAESQCQTREELPIHMIYIDIVGLTQFKRRVKAGYGKFSCLLRIVDSFGTEPAFNFEPYAKIHKLKTQWGMQNLNPQQFFTMFPHSPDNSFMGFVVEEHLNESESLTAIEKRDQAVVYGKAEYMWQGKEDYLSVIHKRLEIHGTVFTDPGTSTSIIPPYVHNHGILSGPDLHRLLRQSKLFIGLGFPYEGPAPLEAIAHGCVFINPQFKPPHNSQNTKFFKGKPTLRKVTSQHPYAEEFIGEPHVYTVDIGDKEMLNQVITRAINDINLNKVRPYMPYEFTKEGMLQRLNAYIENQDFCASSPPQWPPPESVVVIAGDLGKSCKDMCRLRDMICEPSYFKLINNRVSIEKHIGQLCADVIESEDIYFPGFVPASQKCVLQRQPMLFSCVGELADMSRICPCRDYIPGQTALCKRCL